MKSISTKLFSNKTALKLIRLFLRYPRKSTLIQTWTFVEEQIIKIGRARDNHVVLYSSVVSRYHVELRRSDTHWEVINLGRNGIYLDGKRIEQAPILDGAIVSFAISGPQLQINLATSALQKSIQKTMQHNKPVSQKDLAKERKTLTLNL